MGIPKLKKKKKSFFKGVTVVVVVVVVVVPAKVLLVCNTDIVWSSWCRCKNTFHSNVCTLTTLLQGVQSPSWSVSMAAHLTGRTVPRTAS